jgi:hypothetical protein
MTHIEKLIHEDNAAFIVYKNGLGTVTITKIKRDQWQPFQDFIDIIPDEQIIDFKPPATPEAIEEGVAKIGRKERREGEYAGWDEKMASLGLPPASE